MSAAAVDAPTHEADSALDAEATPAADASSETVDAPEAAPVLAAAEPDEAEVASVGAIDEPHHEAADDHVNGNGNGLVNGHDHNRLNGHEDHDEDDADLFFGRPYDHADDEPDWDAMRHPAPAMTAATLASAPAAETTVMDALPAPSSATTDDALITRPGWPLPGDLEAWESADMADMSNHPSDSDLGHWAEAAAARADNGAGFPPHDAGAGPGVNLSSPSSFDAPHPPVHETPTIGTPEPIAFGASHDPAVPNRSQSEGHTDPAFWEIGQQSAAQPSETWPPAPQPSEAQQWTTPGNVAAPGGGTPEPTPVPAAATPPVPVQVPTTGGTHRRPRRSRRTRRSAPLRPRPPACSARPSPRAPQTPNGGGLPPHRTSAPTAPAADGPVGRTQLPARSGDGAPDGARRAPDHPAGP